MLFYRFKVCNAVLAQRTNEVLGQILALINISANLAYPAFFAVGLGLGFNVVLIVGIGHCFLVGYNARLCYAANKHAVGVKVNVVLNLERHKAVDVLGQENKPVVGAQGSAVGKLVNVSAALEAEVLKYLERSLNRQTVNVHNACAIDNMVRIVLFVNADCNAVR